jgi:hypothetical protein
MLDVLYLDVVYAMYALFVVYRAYVVYAAYVCLHVIMYAWLDVCGNDFIEWFHHYWYFCQDVISPFYAYPFPRENQKSWKKCQKHDHFLMENQQVERLKVEVRHSKCHIRQEVIPATLGLCAT